MPHENYRIERRRCRRLQANLGGNGKADGKARKLIEQWFCDYQAWEAEFKKNRECSFSRLRLGHPRVQSANQRTSQLLGRGSYFKCTIPRTVDVLDMYEHAYHMEAEWILGRFKKESCVR